jgi:hypothetical protein
MSGDGMRAAVWLPLATSLTGGLVGVFIGALLQQARERRQWLRNQRLDAYANFVLAARSFEATADVVWNEATTEQPDPSWFLRPLQEADHEFAVADQRAQMIGSLRMRSFADRFRSTAAKMIACCDQIGRQTFVDTELFAKRWSSRDEHNVRRGEKDVFANELPAFVIAAREELTGTSKARRIVEKVGHWWYRRPSD